MAQLPISNVITISVSETPEGLGEYNTSNLAIFTRETANVSFGTDGYKIYLEPTEVGTDFGTDSDTYAMALAVFSQRPNILAGGGYLVVIEYADTANVTEVQTITFSAAPASGTFKLSYDGNETTALNYDDTNSEIQTALRLLSGLGSVVVTGSIATALVVTFTGVTGAAELLEITDNSLQTSDPFNVTGTVVVTTPGSTASTETLATAITRTKDLVQYFGIMTAEITSEVNMDAAAAVVQALNKVMFMVSRTSSDLDPAGPFDDIRDLGYTQTRCLFYGDGDTTDTLVMMAAYAGRALSTNFSGSLTTQNMHLKDLTGVGADSTMTQTLKNKADDAGVDIYPSIQGVSKVLTSGANRFFDQVYNQGWFVGALEVALFNVLAQTSTKIPQTESGVELLKAAARKVCLQGVANGYIAPGEWTSPTTFGNQDDFFENIEQFGFYVYSQPIALQSAADREDRKAPLIQIAIKEAGAINSATVIVNINA